MMYLLIVSFVVKLFKSNLRLDNDILRVNNMFNDKPGFDVRVEKNITEDNEIIQKLREIHNNYKMKLFLEDDTISNLTKINIIEQYNDKIIPQNMYNGLMDAIHEFRPI